MKNKNYAGESVKTVSPLKKIYIKKSKIVIDPKGIDEYGNDKNPQFEFLQNWLSMPLNTVRSDILNLPNKATGSRSKLPYVRLFGTFEKSKSKNPQITLTVGKNESKFTSILDLKENKQSFNGNESIQLWLDKENYQIDNKNLFETYVESGVVDSNGNFKFILFKKISKKFFEYVKSIQNDTLDELKFKKNNFTIFILPSDGKIEYVEKTTQDKPISSFIDSFGNNDTSYASKPTQTAKFLSYDDLAFTINCKKGEMFYKNISVGKKSLEKVNFPKDVFKIAGLFWLFTNISDSETTFKPTNQGIYSQLYENYNTLKKKAGDPHKSRAQMKVLCYKKSMAKTEILLDENITMPQLESIIKRVGTTSPPLAVEVLIETEKNKTIWNNYLYALRTLILGNYLKRDYCLALFTKLVRKELFDWLKKKRFKDATNLFAKTDFCLKLFTNPSLHIAMNTNEEFAFNAGKIAGEYVKFKKSAKEDSNTLNDILTYSKYDREKLRFVLSRVGLGINLSKAQKNLKDDIINFVSKNRPLKEISDSDAFDDYSYFFYKGVFEQLGGKNDGK